ncbi:transposase [Planotetraspora kaengkrachanensis]|uniref:transposase n=1 Tax=Planotetraspora kaengkrachanensis TaxID=575193 RepID=UPI001943AD15
MSDARWALIEPITTAWRTAHTDLGISPPIHALHEIVNAILYVNRTGIAWECLPTTSRTTRRSTTTSPNGKKTAQPSAAERREVHSGQRGTRPVGTPARRRVPDIRADPGPDAVVVIVVRQIVHREPLDGRQPMSSHIGRPPSPECFTVPTDRAQPVKEVPKSMAAV